MKIKVIFTGGTIGSRSGKNCVSLSDAPYELIERYQNEHDGGSETVCFETSEPYNILSEELDENRLTQLAGCVAKSLEDDEADALIVTHGTDTLVYTAAFLGYVFSYSEIPIILVSSGFPLDDKRANGHENFAAAVTLAQEIKNGKAGPYVYAVWHDGEKTLVHLGTRLIPQSCYSDLLQSAGGKYFGEITSGGLELNPQGAVGNRGLRFFRCPDGSFIIGENISFKSILYLTCRPGMYYPDLSGIKAVLLESYHSGTMNADGGFRDFCEKAAKRFIPVFIVGAGGRDLPYETVEKYLDLGVVPLPMVSPSAMYVKLALAAGINANFKHFVTNCISGDFIG